MYAAAKLLHLCPTLCNPIDSSPPGSPIPGILQARILEWVAISFSNKFPSHSNYLNDPNSSSRASLVAQLVKNLPADTRDPGLIPGSGRSPGAGHGNPVQYSRLENPMDRGAW